MWRIVFVVYACQPDMCAWVHVDVCVMTYTAMMRQQGSSGLSIAADACGGGRGGRLEDSSSHGCGCVCVYVDV